MSWILERLFNFFDPAALSMWLISFLSTIPEHALLFAVCSGAIGLSVLVANRIGKSTVCWLLPTLTSLVVFLGLYFLFPLSQNVFYLIFLRDWTKAFDQTPANHPIGVALALTALVAIERSRVWRRAKSDSGTRRLRIGWILTVIVVPAVAVIFVSGWGLRGLARYLHADEAVRQVAAGDFNGLQINLDRRVLFATGHGKKTLLAFDLANLERPPRKAQVSGGYSESFAYNNKDDELYQYDLKTNNLLILDARSLAVKKIVGGLRLAYGDVLVDWEPRTDTIILSSEGEGKKDGASTVFVDRTTGKVIWDLDVFGANAVVHPQKPLYYLGICHGVFCTGADRILALDLKQRRVVATFDPRAPLLMDRMVISPDGRELLVAVPADSAILRLDLDNLVQKGRISTVLGVRTVAVDPKRNLLLTGSLVSNMLDVIDLKTAKSIGRYYIAPWLRTIAVDPQLGEAYVSSTEGLFRIDYLSRLRP